MERPERHKDRPLIIYHSDCMDGLCAAWVAWRTYKDTADYFPARYGTEPPWEMIHHNDVFILDFCYPLDVMHEICHRVWRLTVLDHHVTAAKDMAHLAKEGYPEHIQFVFDMERSGAGITRDFFYPASGIEVPPGHYSPDPFNQEMQDSWLVNYTQDRDLWKFELPKSQEVSAFIGTLAPEFEIYEITHKHITFEEAAILGAGALRYLTMFAKKTMENAILVNFMGFPDIPLVNTTRVGVSEVVGGLADGARFAVGWSQRGDGKVEFSLRSRGAFDVSELARQMGGGGHKNAAGFVIDYPLHDAFSFMRP